MDITTCELRIQTQYLKDPASLENISQLTNKAWWANKAECIKLMGWTQQIKNFLLQKNYIPTPSSSTSTTPSSSVQQTSQQTFIYSKRNESITYYGKMIMIGLISIIVILLLSIIIKQMLRFFYDVFNSKRIIYLKVLLPRGQSKLDREQEKELARDMKEKIWRMSLVIHNFHKIGFLSLKEKFMRYIFDKAKITLIYHYEDGLLYFIIGIYPEYQQIIEGAISAQFPNCSIEKINKPKFFKKKYHDIMPIEPKRDPILNIKTFKQQPDDPIYGVSF